MREPYSCDEWDPKWDPKIHFHSETRLCEVVLHDDFLSPWVSFRDSVPLTPGAVFHAAGLDAVYDFDEHDDEIYADLDSIATCRWDRPTEMDKKEWTPRDHMSCFVYQVTCNLACPGKIFEHIFSRLSLQTGEGEYTAILHINSIKDLTFNLVYYYTNLDSFKEKDGRFECPLGYIVEKIESIRPTPDPSKSPIAQIRRKHALENMNITELRKAFMNKQLQGQDEKSFFVKSLLESEGLAGGDTVEGGGKEEEAG